MPDRLSHAKCRDLLRRAVRLLDGPPGGLAYLTWRKDRDAFLRDMEAACGCVGTEAVCAALKEYEL